MDSILTKNQKKVVDARLVAVRAHGNQAYDEIFPYEKHLDDVVEVLKRHDCDDSHFLIAGYLHDAIEDGSISFKDIKRYFGERVAEMVYCVTDELGRNRKERKPKTLEKIAGNPDAIIIKLADRIANLEHGLEYGGKGDMYVKEHAQFREALGTTQDPKANFLWSTLNRLIDQLR